VPDLFTNNAESVREFQPRVGLATLGPQAIKQIIATLKGLRFSDGRNPFRVAQYISRG